MPFHVECCDKRAPVDEKSGQSNSLRTVKRGNKPNIDGVDINSLIQQQFHNSLILRKVKRGILRLISGVDISSIVQQQFHNGRTTCTVNYVDMVMKRGTPAMIPGVDISSMAQQKIHDGRILCTVEMRRTSIVISVLDSIVVVATTAPKESITT